jgi:hypothetical protein
MTAELVQRASEGIVQFHHPTEIRCADCRYFVPKFYGVGLCRRPWTANSKFWPSELKEGEIFVHISFGCKHWEEAEDPKKESI